MSYKATLTIPTEQYGNMYVETEGTPDDLWQTYQEFRKAIDGGEGITSEDFNHFCEKVLQGQNLEPEHQEEWENMSQKQRQLVKWLYNRLAAIERRNQD